MKISGSIVIFNSHIPEVMHLMQCFLTCDHVAHFFIIDNSPVDQISKHLPQDNRIVYEHYPQNLGYGAAHNKAISKMLHEVDYHVVLNTDLSFKPECISELARFMHANPHVGLVMPKILDTEGKVQPMCRENPTPYLLLVRRFLTSKNNPQAQLKLDHYQNMDKDYEKAMYHIPFLSGCFMFLRTSTLKRSGLFDERIFMYTEDADLTRRILACAETAYWPAAQAVHDFKGGVHKSFKLTWYGMRSAIYYFNKWGWKNDLPRTVVQ